MDKSSTADLVLLTQALKQYKSNINQNQSPNADTINNGSNNISNNINNSPGENTIITQPQISTTTTTNTTQHNNNNLVGSGSASPVPPLLSVATVSNGGTHDQERSKRPHIAPISYPVSTGIPPKATSTVEKKFNLANDTVFFGFWGLMILIIIGLIIGICVDRLSSGDEEVEIYCPDSCFYSCSACDDSDSESTLCGRASDYSIVYCKEETIDDGEPDWAVLCAWGLLGAELIGIVFNTWFFTQMDDGVHVIVAFMTALTFAIIFPFVLLMVACGAPTTGTSFNVPQMVRNNC